LTPEADALVLAHLDLVAKVAARVARKLPYWIDMDEICAAGNLGLVEAASRFDPERHASFAVWAMIRIRGAIIDAYRGKNYPRLMEHLPDSWMGLADGGSAKHADDLIPKQLIDERSVETDLIEREESVVVSITAVKARGELNRVEGRVLDGHLADQSLREIGRSQKRSGAWAHYTLHAAKRKMRARLEVIDGAKADELRSPGGKPDERSSPGGRENEEKAA
jgi:RNA polymerase sigma factor (sigma-70 family)